MKHLTYYVFIWFCPIPPSLVEVNTFLLFVSYMFQEADRLKCATSVVHQADQACRRLISEAMKTARGQPSAPQTPFISVAY